ncbi:MAG: VWA domain-containing protein [Chloroflexi bacterium]|nr:VWA domain-containing protein [Chloroflexota bacterium]MBI3169613.1 VWA domain-containing protein [Chloroflexota bacterium]
MMTKPLRFFLTFVLLGLLIASPTPKAFAQDDTQIRITQVDNSKFPNVTVYVSVTNSAGEPVGVDPASIQISENGEVMQPVDIRGGGEGDAKPLTTMLVIDISGSMDKNGKLDAAKEAAKTYVTQMRAGDQAGLITFDTQTYYVQPVTTDTVALINAIDGLATGGDTSMFDALIEAEKALEGIEGRKAIIVLADGLDNHSKSTAEDVINQIGPSGLTISTIGFGDSSTSAQAGLDEPTLKTLAEKSGGLYSFAADSAALTALYEQYGRTLQSEYAITYVSPSMLRDGVNRNLTVSLSTVGVSTDANYNPGGVLPEVAQSSWPLFGLILGGLLILLLIPIVISRGRDLFGGMKGGFKRKGRIKLAQSASTGRKPNIKIK